MRGWVVDLGVVGWMGQWAGGGRRDGGKEHWHHHALVWGQA